MITPSTLLTELQQIRDLMDRLVRDVEPEESLAALDGASIHADSARASIAATLRLVGNRAFSLAGVLKDE